MKWGEMKSQNINLHSLTVIRLCKMNCLRLNINQHHCNILIVNIISVKIADCDILYHFYNSYLYGISRD